MTDDDDPTNDDDNDDVEICVHFSHAGSSDSTYYTYSAIFAEVEKKQFFLHFEDDTFFPIEEVSILILRKQILLYS